MQVTKNICGTVGNFNCLPLNPLSGGWASYNSMIGVQADMSKGLANYANFGLSSFFNPSSGVFGWVHYGADDGIQTLDTSPNGGVTIGTNGWQDTCASFNGSGAYLSFPGNANVPLGAAARSFEFWVQVPNFTNFFFLINYGTAVSGEQFLFYIDKAGDIDAPGGYAALALAGSDAVHSATKVISGQVQHLVITCNGALSTTLFYINGVTGNSVLTIGDQALNTTMGGSGQADINEANGTAFGAGQMYSCRYWNTILTPADVADLYGLGFSGFTHSRWTQENEMPALFSGSSVKNFPPFQLRAV